MSSHQPRPDGVSHEIEMWSSFVSIGLNRVPSLFTNSNAPTEYFLWALITGTLSLNPPNIMSEFISTSTSFQSKLSELSILNSVPVKSIEALMSTCPEGDDADFFELPHWSEITAMTMMTTTIPRQPSVTRCVCRSSIVFATGCPQPGQATAWSDTFCLQAGHGIIGMSLAVHSQFTRADLYMRDVFPFI